MLALCIRRTRTRVMLHVFREMLQVFLVMLQVFPVMLHVFPVTLQETCATLQKSRATLQETRGRLHETRATLHEIPATLQETSATLNETRATLHKTRPRLPNTQFKPTMLRSIRVIEVITHNITFPRITFCILLPSVARCEVVNCGMGKVTWFYFLDNHVHSAFYFPHFTDTLIGHR